MEWKTGNISFWCNWLELLKPNGFNWVTFTVITFEFEYDKHGPQFELTLGLLGFCGRIALYAPWTTEQSEELQRRFESIKVLKCDKCKEELE